MDFLPITINCVSSTTQIVISDHCGKNFSRKTFSEAFDSLFMYDKGAHGINLSEFNFQIQSIDLKPTKILSVVRRNLSNKECLYELYIGKNHFIGLTGNHLIPAASEKNGPTSLKKVKNLTLNDYILVYDRSLPIGEEGNPYMEKIQNISTDPLYDGFVYDIETGDNHFYANGILCHNCIQLDLNKLFKGGFNTGFGKLREPSNIRSYSSLASIAIQSNQNDCFK